MKFLICGMGSISQRHFRNLKTLLPDCEINVCTAKRDKYRVFDNELNISYTDNLCKIYPIYDIFHDLDEALDGEKYDAVFICSLPPDRIDISIKCAEKGIPFFVEKPLSNNLDKVYKLQEIVEDNKIKCVIGFQMRFHPIIQKIKQMLEKEEFGYIYRIEVNHCNRIDNWTKGRNLKDFYALKKETAGGVLLSQIHEIDYLNYLFGKHYPVFAIYGNILGFEVEDYISIMSNLEIDGRSVPVVINLDFLSKIPTRKIIIYGIEKSETFDLMPGNSTEWNNLFVEEVRAFLSSLGGRDSRIATLWDGIASLEYVMDIKNMNY